MSQKVLQFETTSFWSDRWCLLKWSSVSKSKIAAPNNKCFATLALLERCDWQNDQVYKGKVTSRKLYRITDDLQTFKNANDNYDVNK